MACHCGLCYGYGGGYDGYGGYGREASNGVIYGSFRDKSDSAFLRERTAIDKFNALADTTPANISGGNPLPPLSALAIFLWKLYTKRNPNMWCLGR